ARLSAPRDASAPGICPRHRRVDRRHRPVHRSLRPELAATGLVRDPRASAGWSRAGSSDDALHACQRGVRAGDLRVGDRCGLELGEREHPDHPYSDPRVREHVDDGRAFLRSSPDRYDLIVFALPDSLTLVSTSANVRLESFLFTREAFASARDHLAPNGVFVLYNYYRQPWLLAKIEGMLSDVFETAPLVREYNAPIGSAAVLAASP